MFLKLKNLACSDRSDQQAIVLVDSITSLTRCIGKIYIETKEGDRWVEYYADQVEAEVRYDYLSELVETKAGATIHEMVNGNTHWKTLVDLSKVESLVLDADRFQVRYNTSRDAFVESCDSLHEAEHRFGIAENKWRKALAARK